MQNDLIRHGLTLRQAFGHALPPDAYARLSPPQGEGFWEYWTGGDLIRLAASQRST